MRLAQLIPVREAEHTPYETREDYRELIIKALEEIGAARPKDFYVIWDEDDRDHNGAILQAIKLWKGAVASDEDWRKANNAIWKTAEARIHDVDEAAEAIAEVSRHGVVLQSLQGLVPLMKKMHEQWTLAKDEMKLVQQAYQIIGFLNQRATMTHNSGEDPDDTRYKAAIARATLKKMGLEPVDR